MFWGALWAGSFAGLGLCAVLLLLRGNFRLRRTGVTLMMAMGVASAGLYFVGLNVANGSIEIARSAMRSSPLPFSRFDSCSSTWTNAVTAQRTFVDSDCQTVRSYAGWFESWSYRSESEIDDLHGVGPAFLVVAPHDQGFVAISSDSGDRLWDMQCPGDLNLNEAMFNQGVQTPSEQVVAGTCNGQAFNRDPQTGAAR